MPRKSMMFLLSATIALLVFAPLTFGQQTVVLPKLNPFMTPSTTPSTAAAINNTSPSNGPQLATFSYTVTSSRDGNVYSGKIVGTSPFSNPVGHTNVATQLIPVVIVTNSVFAGVSHGQVLTAPGVTVFDPTVADDSCLSAPNDVPLKLVQLSPIFRRFDFNFAGTDVGVTQTTNAFQRGNFFQLLSPGNSGGAGVASYQVVLDPVSTTPKIIVNIPAADGVAYPSAAFGGCATGKEGIVDLVVYRAAITGLFTQLASQGVNPSTFPLYALHNVVECEGTGCATLNTGGCCVLGFHNHVGQQTYGSADFDTSDIFVNPTPDVSIMSHEVGEWMNDPFGNNLVPAWGHIGQQPGCQGNLEVGDPLSGTLAPPVFNPENGFTYHMQELAFFSWFYGAPSVGVNDWFSDNGTFLSDAGPVCH